MDAIIIKNSSTNGLGVFAAKDFKKGEEITSDYSQDSIQLHHFTCNCGSKQCKKHI